MPVRVVVHGRECPERRNAVRESYLRLCLI